MTYSKFLEEYKKWLEKHKLDEEKVGNSLYPNDKRMLVTAFIREERKGWKITKKELKVMEKYKKPNKSEEYVEKYCKNCIEWPYNKGKDCDPNIPCPINNFIAICKEDE